MGVIWTDGGKLEQPRSQVGVSQDYPFANSVLAAIPGAGWDAKRAQVSIPPLDRKLTARGPLVLFDGTNYITTTVPKLTTPPFTVIFDLYYNASLGAQAFVAQSGISAGGGWSINTVGGQPGNFRLTFGGVADYSFSASSLNQGGLYRLAVVVSGNGGTARYFIDGAFESSRAVDTMNASTFPFSIGAFASNTGYGGSPSGCGIGNVVLLNRALTDDQILWEFSNQFSVYEADNNPVFYSLGGGSNNTATLSSTLDAATLTGVGNVTRSATLAVTLDAATLAGIGGVTTSGTLAVTLDAATLTGVGAVTTSGTLAVTLDAATLAGVGSVAVGTNRDGALAVTLDAATLAGIGAVTRSGTLAVTLDAATLAGIGTAGQPRTGTLAVTLDNATLSGVGAIPAAPSTGGGKTTGKNLSRKQKKKLKAVESQEWLKAEETARQLLSDRFTKQTPQEKAQALETHIESLTPVIEALKAITDQIEDVQETVQETKTEELTEHKQILNKFDALITKMTSIEELLIIMLAQ